MTERSITRREFAQLTVAAGVTAAASSSAAALEVQDVEVLVKMPSGECDAVLVQPKGARRRPAVILFVDAFGLRPAMRDMARRLAAQGYVVLVPNPYYRSTKAPGIGPGFDFGSPADRAKLEALRAPLTTDGVQQDAGAYIAFLDSQPGVDLRAKMGVVGYCMGGPMTMQAAAGYPQRIGAGASFHGGGLVTNQPQSPHLLAPAMRAQYYVGIAMNDDVKDPEAKQKLETAFGAAHLIAKIEVYEGTVHGWCVKDMPMMGGATIYNEAQAERAWGELLRLYQRALL